MKKLIGVCGAIGAGKGEVSARIAKLLNIPDVAFATPLKEIVHSAKCQLNPSRANKETPQQIELFYGDVFKIVNRYFGNNGHDFCIAATNRLFDILSASLPAIPGQPGRSVVFTASYRQMYQLVGTDWGRNTIRPDVWLKLRPDECVVNDVRAFADAPEPQAEPLSIIEDEGIIIRVRRAEAEEVDKSNGHASEFPVDSELVEIEIDNNGTLDDLDKVVKAALIEVGYLEAPKKTKAATTKKTTKTDPKLDKGYSGEEISANLLLKVKK